MTGNKRCSECGEDRECSSREKSWETPLFKDGRDSSAFTSMSKAPKDTELDRRNTLGTARNRTPIKCGRLNSDPLRKSFFSLLVLSNNYTLV